MVFISLLTLEYSNTHRDIIERCKRGNRPAQFELYRLYSRAMYNVCLRMVRNELDAEDILQHSFTDVFTKLYTFRYQSSIGAWIKRIMVNNCINFMKRKRMRFDELEERHTANLADKGGKVETSKLNVKAINEAIYKLPDGYRVVFSLYTMEGYDHKEIAQILNISEATSKSQYSRAKKKLRDMLNRTKLVS